MPRRGLSRACDERDHTVRAVVRLRQPPRELRTHPSGQLRAVEDSRETTAAAREDDWITG